MELRCKDVCGAVAIVDGDTPPPGDWYYLEISRTWRCQKCSRELKVAEGITGPDTPFVDEIPPESRGALPKETASTILPPSHNIPR